MAALILGVVLWLVLAASAWKYSNDREALYRTDRIGAAVFFLVVGVPVFIFGLALIAHIAKA